MENPRFEVIILAMLSRVSSHRFYDLGASQSLREFAAKYSMNSPIKHAEPVLGKQDLDRARTQLSAHSLHTQSSQPVSYAHAIDSLLHSQASAQGSATRAPLCIIGFDELGLEQADSVAGGDLVWEDSASPLISYLSPSDCRAHYCFTTRPYDELRPKSWHSIHIAPISKLCYVEYGIHPFGLHECEIVAYDKSYLRYYDYLFSPTAFHAQTAQAQQTGRSLLHIEVAGSARIEELIESSARHLGRLDSIPSPKSHRPKLRVLYLPRWSLQDLHSTFSRYIELLLDEARAGRIALHFRPHPNFYDHVVNEQKIMTQAQWDRFKSDVQEYGFWDESPNILESFSRADVLISDTSSALIYAFLSGKPTIYTQGSFRAELNSWALRIAQGCFIASSADELLELLARFGDDYKGTFATRLALRDEILKQAFYLPEGGSARFITQWLLDDYARTLDSMGEGLAPSPARPIPSAEPLPQESLPTTRAANV